MPPRQEQQSLKKHKYERPLNPERLNAANQRTVVLTLHRTGGDVELVQVPLRANEDILFALGRFERERQHREREEREQ